MPHNHNLKKKNQQPNIASLPKIIENQVTLEEQMICGALQTLNEEAFEDVIASERPSPTGGPSTGETIVLDMNMQAQPQQTQQQPLTPIEETAEIERSLAYTHAGTTAFIQPHQITMTTAIDNTIGNNNSNNNNNNNDSIDKNSNLGNRSTIPVITLAIGKGNNIRSHHTIPDAILHEPIHTNAKYRTLSASSTSLPPLSSLSSSTSSLLCASIPLSNASTTANHKQTIISVTPPSPSGSTIILMPGGANVDSKSFIDDTRL